jgi:cysteine desulfurase family protein (TIGR01976 family)
MKAIENRFRQIRTQFPSLQRNINGQPAVFFDGPAGTQVPKRVVEAISNYLYGCNANHAGLFDTSVESDRLLDDAHRAFAELVGATDGDEIMFGQNMTSLTFSLSRAIARQWQPGDEVIVTRLDHDANVSPWVLAAQDRGAVVKFVEFCQDDFTLDMDHFREQLSDRTRLVAVGCASNATGGVNPVKEVCRLARERGALSFLDAVHFAPHELIDVRNFGCDFLACSAYKFFGPHLGICWGKRELLESLPAYKVRPATDELPGKWMTGTQSHEAIAGGLAAVDYLADVGRAVAEQDSLTRREAIQAAFAAIRRYENSLSQQMLAKLKDVPGLRIWGITDPVRVSERFPTFSITIDGIASTLIAQQLADRGIFVWHGHYYALEFYEANKLQPEGMVRIGLVHYNDASEIDRLIDSLQEICVQQTVL